MDEREDFNLDDIFAEVGSVLKGESRPEVVRSVYEEESEDELLIRYSNSFISEIYPMLSRINNPLEIAPKLKEAFEKFKERRVKIYLDKGDRKVADVVSRVDLQHVIKAAEDNIYEAEKGTANYEPGSFEYRDLETQIRKLEIIQRAAGYAQDL